MLFKASMTYLKCKHASTHVHTPVRQYHVVEKSRTVQGAEKTAVLCMLWNQVFPSETLLEGAHEIFITQLAPNISIYCIVALSQ